MFYKDLEFFVTLCTVLKGSIRFKKFQIGSKMFKNVQKCSKMFKNVQKCSKKVLYDFLGFRAVSSGLLIFSEVLQGFMRIVWFMIVI